MNNNAMKFIKSISYSITSNLVSTLISSLIILILPKLIGMEEYGYWQLYIFYIGYVGFLQFGWNDGIYLRYSGLKYEDLNKKEFYSQYVMLSILQALLAVLFIMLSYAFTTDSNRITIVIGSVFCMFFSNLQGMLTYILQCTYRIREYSLAIVLGKIVYCILVIILLLFGVRSFKLLIIADIIGRIFSLFYSSLCCKEIVLNKISSFQFNFIETYKNISVGIKLMFANIASMLIIGVVRFGIERSWNVVTFGKISLVLSISNFLMIFINAIGLVIFPILRRTDEKKLPRIYNMLRDLLMIVLFAVLILYYPFKAALSIWLPKYVDSLKYLAILFPMCIYEGKMSLLINTYLNTIRKEKLILKVNLITLALSIMVTFISTYIMNNLNLAVTTILFLLAFRCILGEKYLSEILYIPVTKDIILELIVIAIFIISGEYINSWLAILIYGITYIFYLFIKQKDLKKRISKYKIV